MSNARILQGSVFDMLPTIEPGSIDCAVTSPPYWMLRSYLPKGHALKALELGQEPTPQEYVANCVRWCGLVRDCLADHGTLWLNVGDTYSGGNRGAAHGVDEKQPARRFGARANETGGSGWTGNLCLIPQRLMIALQDDGWLVRSVVIWHKPAPMPTSVTGWMWRKCRVKSKAKVRVTGLGSGNADFSFGGGFAGDTPAEWTDCPGCKKCEAHGGYVLRRGSWRPTSAWEPVIMLAKTSRYFCDGEAVKTPPADSTVSRDQYTRVLDDPDEQFAVAHDHETICDGANLRDVWKIAAEPLREKHYAAYPSELVYRCFAAGTSQEGYCDKCGGPFVRVVVNHPPTNLRLVCRRDMGDNRNDTGRMGGDPVTETIGWRPSCSCPSPTPRPGRVLDPFCGSGRTGIVARRLGLDFVGCELNPEYVDMSKRRITDDAPLFNEVTTSA